MFVPWTRKKVNRNNTWATKNDAYNTQISVRRRGKTNDEQDNLATNMFANPAQIAAYRERVKHSQREKMLDIGAT